MKVVGFVFMVVWVDFFLGEPVWVGGLCEVKTNEVLGLWICVWVVGFV
jgi:hypothetical protein